MTPPLSLLGVRFHRTTVSDTIKRMDQACEQDEPLFVVTPNPEICLLAERLPDYQSVLSSAGLSLPDGFGILWAARYQQGPPSFFRWVYTLLTPWKTLRNNPLGKRVTGTDVVQQFCQHFPQRKIFLLGASQAVNERLTHLLKSEGVNIVGHYSGTPDSQMENILRSMIDSSEAEVLFVAFGAPQQEQWIMRNLSEMPLLRVAMGIGGAFDFMAGERRRAPLWMQRCGLEWLFRLLIEPRRIKRIFNATVRFPIRVFISHKKP